MLGFSSFYILTYFFNAVLLMAPSLATSLGPQYVIDTQNVQHLQEMPAAAYEYTIVPSSDYTAKENRTSEISLVDGFIHPLSALAYLGSKAVSIVKWMVITFSPVLLGIGLVFAFCAFTDYCSLTIEYPFSSDLEMRVPNLDNVEHFVMAGYNKYHDIQNQIL